MRRPIPNLQGNGSRGGSSTGRFPSKGCSSERLGLQVRRSGGFTLLEVALALLILVLIAGTLFGVVQGTLTMAAGLEESQRREQEINGLYELCRRTFRTLPSQAKLVARVRETGGKKLPELIFYDAPEQWVWSQIEDWDAVSALGLRPQPGGLFSLALLRQSQGEDAYADVVIEAPAGEWLVLMRDVVSLQWRFYNPELGTWMEVLDKGSPRPSAAELTLELAGEEEVLRMVFWLVPVQGQIQVPVGGDAEKTPEVPAPGGDNP